MERSCECGNELLGSMKCWESSSGCTTTGGLLSSAELNRVS
jgi:hypothetical protein